jgi:hypothetical protein
MRAFIMACLAAAAISLGVAAVLTQFQEPAAVAYSTSAVRLETPPFSADGRSGSDWN